MDDPENKVTETEEKVEEKVEEKAADQTEEKTADEKAADEAKAQTEAPERIKELTDKVKQLEEQAAVSAQQAAIAKANPVQGNQPAADQFDIYKEAGLDPEDPDEVPTQAQLKKILNHHGTVFSRQLADLAFHQSHSDYTQMVGTADEIASGKYAGPLAAAIQKNPALLTMIAQSKNPRVAAYEIAKLQKSQTKTPVETDAAKEVIDEAVENANRVKSSANTKGGDALSEKGRIDNMSDKDFVKLALGNGAII